MPSVAFSTKPTNTPDGLYLRFQFNQFGLGIRISSKVNKSRHRCRIFRRLVLQKYTSSSFSIFAKNLTWSTKLQHQKSARPLSTAQSSPRPGSPASQESLFIVVRSIPSNHVHQHWYQRLRPHRPVSSTHCKNRAYILCSDESSSKQLRRCNSTASSPIGRVQCWEHRRQAINHRRRIVGSKVQVGMSQCECPSVVAVLQGRI